MLNRRSGTDEEVSVLGSQAVGPLIEIFHEIDANWEMEAACLRSVVSMLGVLGGDRAAAFLADLYRRSETTDKTMQAAAAAALARTDHETGLSLVLPLLETGDTRLRKAVVTGLLSSRRPEVLQRVRECARTDPEEAIRRHARFAVEAIENRLKSPPPG